MFNEPVNFSNTKPLYLQVSEAIETKIINKEIAIGQKIPTQRELCKIFKVSKDTVLLAITELVKEGYILCRPKRGTHVINDYPAFKDTNKQYKICAVYCPPEKKTITECLSHILGRGELTGIESAMIEKDWPLYRAVMEGNELIFLGKDTKPDGFIVLGNISLERLNVIRELKIPFVVIGDVLDGREIVKDIDVVTDYDFDKTYMATKHLISLGHTKILYSAGSFDRYPWNKDALNGYRQALEEAGIVCDKNLEILIDGLHPEKGYEQIKELRAKSVGFTGIVSINEDWCTSARKALLEEGLRVPEDISIVVCGNSGLFTLVYSFRYRLGVIALQRIAEKINDPQGKSKRVNIAAWMTERGTTGKIRNS